MGANLPFEEYFPRFSRHFRHSRRTNPVKGKHLLSNQTLNTLEIVGKIHQTHPNLRTCNPEAAQENAAPVIFLGAKHMFDTRPDAGLLLVGRFL